MKKFLLFFVVGVIIVFAFYYSNKSNVVLPQPTGKFLVGTTAIHCIDTTRRELHDQSSPEHNREFMVQIWYPAQRTEHALAPYIPYKALSIIKEDFSRLENKPVHSFDYLDTMQSHAYSNAPVSEQQPNYPVLLFVPGFGTPVWLYSLISEELASHGYIVMAISHTYVAQPTLFPNDRIIEQAKQLDKAQEFKIWLADVQYLLAYIEQLNKGHGSEVSFQDKLNLQAIGILGHSFGGAVALEMCRDPQIKACIDLDGKLRDENTTTVPMKPVMILLSERTDEASKQETKKLENFLGKINSDSSLRMIKDAQHSSFTDYGFVTRTEKNNETMQVIRSFITHFFDKYLKNKDIMLQ